MSYPLQPVPADVLAVLRAVADDVLRASRRLSARLKRGLARGLALPLALLAFATGAHVLRHPGRRGAAIHRRRRHGTHRPGVRAAAAR